jgi:CRISPR-associated endonuclease Csn1
VEKYRLGLDIGTNSIGWCVLELNNENRPCSVQDMGVRIFSSGMKAKSPDTSNAAERREAKQARKRRDSYLKRRSQLMEVLIDIDIMPKDEPERKKLESLDPYALRAKGLDDELSRYELGRAIFHLNQRRGFLSNRKVDKPDKDKEQGKIESAIRNLREILKNSNCRTIGEFLYKRHIEKKPVRSRLTADGYEFYPHREMLAEELDILWKKQSAFHKNLTREQYERIYDVIFFQRPLKPVKPGKCLFEPDEYRAPRAHPLFQRFRIYQDLSNLRIISPDHSDRPLHIEERNILFDELLTKQTLRFTTMKKLIHIGRNYQFNFESNNKDKLEGDKTGGAMSGKERFGSGWYDFSLEDQANIIERILYTDPEDDSELIDWLMNSHSLNMEKAESVVNAFLPVGYSKLGLKAMGKIIHEMEKEVTTYDKAVIRAGYNHHSFFENNERLDRLPYYGEVLSRHVIPGTGNTVDKLEKRYGKIPNPTVHIGLNQTRRIVNAIIKKYGHPEQVVVEMARDLKNSKKVRDKINKEQKQNREANEKRKLHLTELGLPVNHENLLRLRLWEELGNNPVDRKCVYTGDQISIEMLFGPEIEIDHILPFSRTLDNSAANRIVCLRKANRLKGNKTPCEAFSVLSGWNWEAITGRAKNLPPNKRWRFGEKAMERYDSQERDFIDRQLQDTQYLSRVVREYLTHICPGEVWVTPGRLTALLRGKWGLQKEREDHFHHAIDAAVVGVTDRWLLNRISRKSADEKEKNLPRFLSNIDIPWRNFMKDILNRADSIVVSHKVDHGLQGQLHNETAYSMKSETDTKAVHRIPITSIKNMKDIKIRDKAIKKRIEAYVEQSDKTFNEAIQEFSDLTGICRIRIIEDKDTVLIPIRDKNGKIYKGVKGDSNAYAVIYADSKGKWQMEIISTFDANQEGFIPEYVSSGHSEIMRLFRDDTLEINDEGTRRIMRVQKLNNRAKRKTIILVDHYIANADTRHKNKDDPFKMEEFSALKLQKKSAKQVYVNELGEIIYVAKKK